MHNLKIKHFHTKGRNAFEVWNFLIFNIESSLQHPFCRARVNYLRIKHSFTMKLGILLLIPSKICYERKPKLRKFYEVVNNILENDGKALNAYGGYLNFLSGMDFRAVSIYKRNFKKN